MGDTAPEGADLFLYYPQWQGSGVRDEVSRGAETLKGDIQEAYGTQFAEVDVSDPDIENEDHSTDTLEDVLQSRALSTNFMHARQVLDKHGPRRIFTLGGDGGVELAPISWLNQKHEGDFAVVWFDAHGGLNAPESSPSGAFHGMVLRNLLAGEDVGQHKAFTPLKAGQVILAGVRALDAAEKDFVEHHGITIDHCDNLEASGGSTLAHMIVQRGYRRCYVHIDADVLSLEDFKSTPSPEENGIRFETLQNCIRELRAKFDVVGGSLCGVAGGIKGHPGTREMLAKVFNSLHGFDSADG